MPTRNRFLIRGVIDVLALLGVAFLVTSLFAVTVTVSDPLKKQLVETFARRGDGDGGKAAKQAERAKNAQNAADSKIRRKERESRGGCDGAQCVAQEVVANSQGTQGLEKPSDQQIAEQKIIDQFVGAAASGDVPTQEFLKNERPDLYTEAVEQSSTQNLAAQAQERRLLELDAQDAEQRVNIADNTTDIKNALTDLRTLAEQGVISESKFYDVARVATQRTEDATILQNKDRFVKEAIEAQNQLHVTIDTSQRQQLFNELATYARLGVISEDQYTNIVEQSDVRYAQAEQLYRDLGNITNETEQKDVAQLMTNIRDLSNQGFINPQIYQEIDQTYISQADYDRCASVNGPSECLGYLDDIGKFEYSINPEMLLLTAVNQSDHKVGKDALARLEELRPELVGLAEGLVEDRQRDAFSEAAKLRSNGDYNTQVTLKNYTADDIARRQCATDKNCYAKLYQEELSNLGDFNKSFNQILNTLSLGTRQEYSRKSELYGPFSPEAKGEALLSYSIGGTELLSGIAVAEFAVTPLAAKTLAVLNLADDVTTVAACVAGDQNSCQMAAMVVSNPIPGATLSDDVLDVANAFSHTGPKAAAGLAETITGDTPTTNTLLGSSETLGTFEVGGKRYLHIGDTVTGEPQFLEFSLKDFPGSKFLPDIGNPSALVPDTIPNNPTRIVTNPVEAPSSGRLVPDTNPSGNVSVTTTDNIADQLSSDGFRKSLVDDNSPANLSEPSLSPQEQDLIAQITTRPEVVPETAPGLEVPKELAPDTSNTQSILSQIRENTNIALSDMRTWADNAGDDISDLWKRTTGQPDRLADIPTGTVEGPHVALADISSTPKRDVLDTDPENLGWEGRIEKYEAQGEDPDDSFYKVQEESGKLSKWLDENTQNGDILQAKNGELFIRRGNVWEGVNPDGTLNYKNSVNAWGRTNFTLSGGKIVAEGVTIKFAPLSDQAKALIIDDIVEKAPNDGVGLEPFWRNLKDRGFTDENEIVRLYDEVNLRIEARAPKQNADIAIADVPKPAVENPVEPVQEVPVQEIKVEPLIEPPKARTNPVDVIFGEQTTIRVSNKTTGNTVLRPGDSITYSGTIKIPDAKASAELNLYWQNHVGGNRSMGPFKLTEDGIPVNLGEENYIQIGPLDEHGTINPYQLNKQQLKQIFGDNWGETLQITITRQPSSVVTIIRANPQPGFITFRGTDGTLFPEIRKVASNITSNIKDFSSSPTRPEIIKKTQNWYSTKAQPFISSRWTRYVKDDIGYLPGFRRYLNPIGPDYNPQALKVSDAVSRNNEYGAFILTDQPSVLVHAKGDKGFIKAEDPSTEIIIFGRPHTTDPSLGSNLIAGDYLKINGQVVKYTGLDTKGFPIFEKVIYPGDTVLDVVDRVDKALTNATEPRGFGCREHLCELSAAFVKTDAEIAGLKADNYNLTAINMARGVQPKDSFFHEITIVTDKQGNRYLVDLTFGQFSSVDQTNPIVKALNENGFIPLTEKSLNEYLDLTVNGKYSPISFETLGQVRSHFPMIGDDKRDLYLDSKVVSLNELDLPKYKVPAEPIKQDGKTLSDKYTEAYRVLTAKGYTEDETFDLLNQYKINDMAKAADEAPILSAGIPEKATAPITESPKIYKPLSNNPLINGSEVRVLPDGTAEIKINTQTGTSVNFVKLIEGEDIPGLDGNGTVFKAKGNYYHIPGLNEDFKLTLLTGGKDPEPPRWLNVIRDNNAANKAKTTLLNEGRLALGGDEEVAKIMTENGYDYRNINGRTVTNFINDYYSAYYAKNPQPLSNSLAPPTLGRVINWGLNNKGKITLGLIAGSQIAINRDAIVSGYTELTNPGYYSPTLGVRIIYRDGEWYRADNGEKIPNSLNESYQTSTYFGAGILQSLAGQHLTIDESTFNSPEWQSFEAKVRAQTAANPYDVNVITEAVFDNLTYNPSVAAAFYVVNASGNIIEQPIYTRMWLLLGGLFTDTYSSRNLQNVMARNDAICFDLVAAEQTYLAKLGIKSEVASGYLGGVGAGNGHAFLLITDKDGNKWIADPTAGTVTKFDEYITKKKVAGLEITPSMFKFTNPENTIDFTINEPVFSLSSVWGFGTGGKANVFTSTFESITKETTKWWQNLPFNRNDQAPTSSETFDQKDSVDLTTVEAPVIPEQSFSQKADLLAQEAAAENKSFGIPRNLYEQIYSDGVVTPDEEKLLYETYYVPSPTTFMGSATNFGSRDTAVATILTYGSYIRQQMQRGWVLEASGKYGFHPELLDPLQDFHFIYTDKNRNDILLSSQNSTLYTYFADQNPGVNGEPTPITYDQLNPNQKRLYDLTNVSPRNFVGEKLITITEQSKMTPQQALNSGKYIGIIATKSVNDLGRRFLLYKQNSETGARDFVGVVIVGDYAKRDDWIGSGSPTQQANADFYNFPLGTRVQNDQQWGFDLTQDLYDYYGGTGGPAFGVIAVDPDALPKYSPPAQSATSLGNDKESNDRGSTYPSTDNFSVYLQRNGSNAPINASGDTMTSRGCGPATAYNVLQLTGQNPNINNIVDNFYWNCKRGCATDATAVLLTLQRNGYKEAVSYGDENRITDANELKNYTGILIYGGTASSPTESVAHIAGFNCNNGSCVSIDSYFSDGKPVKCSVEGSDSIKCGNYNYHVGPTGGTPDALYPVKSL